MRTKTSIACAVIAVILLGCSVFSKPKPVDPTPAAIIASLEFDLKNLQAECLTYKSELDELKARPPQVVEKIVREPADTTELESLRVQLAKAEKEIEEAYADRVETIKKYETQKKSNECEIMSTYQPRRRLFGRFR